MNWRQKLAFSKIDYLDDQTLNGVAISDTRDPSIGVVLHGLSERQVGSVLPTRVMRSASLLRSALPVGLATVGCVLVLEFSAGSVLSIQSGIVLFFVLALFGLLFPGAPFPGVLARSMVLIYSLPFSVLLGYLFEPDYVWMLTPRGQEVISDRALIAELIAIGTIGLVGFILGLRVAPAYGTKHPSAEAPVRTSTLTLPLFAALLVCALGLSWLTAPKETILQAAYFTEQSETAAGSVNFPAAGLVSYIVIIVLAIDLTREADRITRRLKSIVFAVGVSYVVLVLQLLRGDRESSGLILALLGLFITEPLFGNESGMGRRRALARVAAAAVPALLLVGAFIALGEARGTFNDVAERVGVRQTFLLGLSQNTWTAVLWTHLSAMWEYHEGLLTFKWGSTYVDYVLSLPPGILTQALGIERPFEAWRNINLEDAAGVSAGGLHAVVTPFKNFGAVGALGVLFIWGLLIGRLEKWYTRGTLAARMLWASVLCSGFLWFWYGDMPFIRASLTALILYVTYRTLISVSSPRRSRVLPSQAGPSLPKRAN